MASTASHGGSFASTNEPTPKEAAEPSAARGRAEEDHRLLLRRPSEVLSALRRAGFAARTLAPDCGGEPLPRGLTAFLGRRR